MTPSDSDIIAAASSEYIADMSSATGEAVTTPEKHELVETGYYERARRRLMRAAPRDDSMEKAIAREDRADLTRDVIPELTGPIKKKRRKTAPAVSPQVIEKIIEREKIVEVPKIVRETVEIHAPPKLVVEKRIVEIHHIAAPKSRPAPRVPRIQGNAISKTVSALELFAGMVSAIRAGLSKS